MTAQDETALDDTQFAAQATEFDAQVQREKTSEFFPRERVIEEKLRLMSELPGTAITFTQEEYEQMGFVEDALTAEEAREGALAAWGDLTSI